MPHRSGGSRGHGDTTRTVLRRRLPSSAVLTGGGLNGVVHTLIRDGHAQRITARTFTNLQNHQSKVSRVNSRHNHSLPRFVSES